MAKSIDIVISTILKKTGIDAARAQIKHLAETVGRNLQNIKAGFDMASAGIRTFVSAMQKGMEFERLTLQFKQLTGSMETARAHMQALQDLGRTPPFDLETFATASREMLKLSGGVLGFRKEMELVGDVAAATGSDLASVSRAVGLAYQSIRDGQGFGRAGQQLVMLGALTRKQVAHFDELAKSGADNAAVWAELTAELGRYSGSMAETEKTAQGLVDAIGGELQVAVKDFSLALSESAKPTLESILEIVKRINEDGTIEDWADNVKESLEQVTGAVKYATVMFTGLWKVVKSTLGTALAFGAGADQSRADGGSFLDQIKTGASFAKELLKQTWSDDNEDDLAGMQREERIAAKREKKRKEQEKLDKQASERQQQDLAQAQEETNKRIAEKKADDEAKAAKKAEEQRLKAVAAEQMAREKMEDDLHRQRIKNAEKEISASQKKQGDMQNVASAAQTEFDRAFAMYRDKDLAARTIQEERDYAEDYKRLGRDANRYGGKWRIDELASLMAAGDTAGQKAALEQWRKNSSFTPEVEAMVRASAADQARTTAEDELRKISHNTESLSNKLDELLKVK